jgi:hypothetical protein
MFLRRSGLRVVKESAILHRDATLPYDPAAAPCIGTTPQQRLTVSRSIDHLSEPSILQLTWEGSILNLQRYSSGSGLLLCNLVFLTPRGHRSGTSAFDPTSQFQEVGQFLAVRPVGGGSRKVGPCMWRDWGRGLDYRD